MQRDLLLVFASIGTSLVVIPAIVLYILLVRGISSIGSAGLHGLGLVAMLPGLLMGATALWIAARG